MPVGSFDLSPVPAGQATAALPIAVCLYTPGDENPYTILPNVRCLRIDYREGPEPPLARFQYFMDDLLEASLGWPSQFESLWPINAQGNYVVLTDDRLVVLTQIPPATPDGGPQTVVLFDGFAEVPQADLFRPPVERLLSLRMEWQSASGTCRSPAACSGTLQIQATRPAAPTCWFNCRAAGIRPTVQPEPRAVITATASRPANTQRSGERFLSGNSWIHSASTSAQGLGRLDTSFLVRCRTPFLI